MWWPAPPAADCVATALVPALIVVVTFPAGPVCASRTPAAGPEVPAGMMAR